MKINKGAMCLKNKKRKEEASFVHFGHNTRSHSSQGGKDAVFGTRANWTEQ